jgi:hypothetical protein
MPGRNDACIAAVVLLFCLLPSAGCAFTRNAEWRDPNTVWQIDISRSAGAEFQPVKTISDRGRINAFVGYLNRYQKNWKPSYVTAPAGELRVTCWADDEKMVYPRRLPERHGLRNRDGYRGQILLPQLVKARNRRVHDVIGTGPGDSGRGGESERRTSPKIGSDLASDACYRFCALYCVSR